MRINPDHVLTPVLFPLLLVLPPHEAQTIMFLLPCSTTFSQLGIEDLAISLDSRAGLKLSLGHMLSFVLSGVRGISPAAEILLTIKWAEVVTKSCSLAAVITSRCMLYKR